MSYTMTVQTVVAVEGQSLTGTATANAEAIDKREVVLAENATDVEIVQTLDVSEVKGLVLLCSADATLKTNSSSEPDDTISLTAGRSVSWLAGQGTNPLTADVTRFFASSTAGGTLRMWFLSDPTP